jgi:tetratricopeptide (TPR) repeat protein
LVARLEADEKKRTEGQAADLFSEPAHQELISQVKVELPKAPKKKKVPDWVVMLGLAALVVGGVGAVYSAVKKEPPPKAVVDPALEAAAERRKMAMAALEEGHTFALEGQKGADQAIAAYERALGLEPTLAPAERGIAIAFAAKDDDATAVKHYRRYLELAPDAKDAEEVQKIIKRWEEAEARKKGR